MTFAQLLTEFYARGFDYLNDSGAGTTRAKAWINDAYHEINEEELWPYRFTTATGTSPLTIADLGPIASATETGTSARLIWRDRRDLVDIYRDLTTTGTPQFFYVPTGSGVSTYPVGGTLSISYYKVATDLSADSDTPIVPARFHQAIIDGAVRRAYEDGDNFQAAQAVEGERQLKLNRMRKVLLDQQVQDDPVVIEVGGGEDW